LDAVALRHTVAINGAESLSVMLLDVLSEFETLKVCTAYRLDGEIVENFPADCEALDRAEPIYDEFDGWQTDVSGVRSMDELPAEAREYLSAIEHLTGATVEMVSVGPERDQIARRDADG
jgi:adenylosuccinate synthase